MKSQMDCPESRIGQMPIFFLHIPKTAGTAVRHFLEAPLRRHEIVRVHGSAEEYERRRKEPFGPKVKFLSGHVPYWFGEALPARQTMLFLRDPVERVLSTFYFWKSLPKPSPEDHSPEADLLRRTEHLTLEEFIHDPASPGGGSISNFSCRLVGHAQPWQVDSPFDEKIQALACARLESIELLGIAEQMSESLELIARRLGIPFAGSLPRQNVTQGRRGAADIAPSLVRAIRDANEGDIALWESGRAELARRLRAGRPAPQGATDHRFLPVMREGKLRLLLGEDPILGSGWFEAERGKGGASWRFASASRPTTLHMRLPSERTYMMLVDSPFAVRGFNYNSLAIKVDGALIPCFPLALPDRTLIITAPIQQAKGAAREFTFEGSPIAAEARPTTDSRDISFAVHSIVWLSWTDENESAWSALQAIAQEMSHALETARADKASMSAQAETLSRTIESKDLQIQALQAELERFRRNAGAQAA